MTQISAGLRAGLAGRLGDEIAGALLSVLDTLGGDGSGEFTTLDVSSNAVFAANVDALSIDAGEITVDGNTAAEFIHFDSSEAQINASLYCVPADDQSLENDETITVGNYWTAVVTNDGNVTGIIMSAGMYDGQMVVVVNKGSGSVTFATGATSRVADGTSGSIAVNRALVLLWDAASSRWYRTG